MKVRIIAIIFLIVSSCAKDYNPAESLNSYPKIYTLYNIHYDTNENRVFTTNYQQESYIPLCTEVKLVSIDNKIIKFRTAENQKDFIFLYHKAVGEPLSDHVLKAFGPNCPKNEIKSLSKIDQKGIVAGKPFIGMSKQGILYALGRPPIHVNPNIDSNDWLYWENRFNKTKIIFSDQGIVQEIKE